MGNLGRAGYGASLDGLVRQLFFCLLHDSDFLHSSIILANYTN
jgi:hypothetical protein